MVKHRRAIDVDPSLLVAALETVPFCKVQPNRPLYGRKNFKQVPDWSGGQKLIACLHHVVGLTAGRGILQLNMRAGVTAWNAKHELGLNDVSVDDIAYSLRALLHQLLNLKKRCRLIPPMWKSKYQTLYDKLDAQVDDDEVPGAPSTLPPMPSLPAPVGDIPVHIESDAETVKSSSTGHDPSELFSSDNPALNRLLQPRRRIRSKGKHDEIPTDVEPTATTMDIDAIEKAAGHETADFVPKDWANLNKALKSKAPKAQPKAPATKKARFEKSTATPKAASAAGPPSSGITFAIFVKREHSKVYHKTRLNHEKAGMETDVAKKLATEAARAKAAELRDQRHFGEYS